MGMLRDSYRGDIRGETRGLGGGEWPRAVRRLAVSLGPLPGGQGREGGRGPVVAKILLVEDDPDLAPALEATLRQSGYEAVCARTGRQALQLLQDPGGFDLVVLDLMLPDLSGLEVCGRIRRTPSQADLPVLMLTALGTETDKIAGFRRGADDYLVKPPAMRELTLRIEALLRRSGGRPPPNLQLGPVSLDPQARTVEVDGRLLGVTPTEWKLLHELVSAGGGVCSRSDLMERAWDDSGERTERAVDVAVLRLRRKMGRHGGWIRTMRGAGYALIDPGG